MHHILVSILIFTVAFAKTASASTISSAGTLYTQINGGVASFLDDDSTIVGNAGFPGTTDVFVSDSVEVDSTWLGEWGLGVYVLPAARLDVTLGILGMTDVEGDYRISGHDQGDFAAMDASLQVTTQFLNAYLNIPNLFAQSWRVNPYIGAGVGMAQPHLSSFSLCIPAQFACSSTSDSNTENQFAWRVIGGLEVPVTRQFLIDFAYRYMDAGEAKGDDETPLTITYSEPLEFDVKTQELLLGIRYRFK